MELGKALLGESTQQVLASTHCVCRHLFPGKRGEVHTHSSRTESLRAAKHIACRQPGAKVGTRLQGTRG